MWFASQSPVVFHLPLGLQWLQVGSYLWVSQTVEINGYAFEF